MFYSLKFCGCPFLWGKTIENLFNGEKEESALENPPASCSYWDFAHPYENAIQYPSRRKIQEDASRKLDQFALNWSIEILR